MSSNNFTPTDGDEYAVAYGGDDEADLEESVDDGTAAAQRTLVLCAVALVVVIGAVVGSLFGVFGDNGESTVEPAAAVADDASTTSVGPRLGTDVATYVSQRRAALDASTVDSLAVVSFTAYLSDDEVGDLLGYDVSVSVRLVAFVGGEPTSTEDIDAARRAVRDDAEAQLAEVESIAPTVENDPDYEAFYAAEITRYRSLLDAIDRPDVVFAVVVTGSAQELQDLATKSQVRLVDVGSGVTAADNATFAGLRPEEVVVTGEPISRP